MTSLYDEAMVALHVPGLKVVDEIPGGYRQMQEILDVREKAMRFQYHSWEIWVPKRCVRQLRNKREFWAAAWAVESSKEYQMGKRA